MRNSPARHGVVTGHGGTQQFAKTAFPTDFVYGPRPVPLLRMMTCAGTFDPRVGAYVDNLVVTAHQVPVVGSR
jgi:hypothetical protein